MHDTIQSRSATHFTVFLDAAAEAYLFPHSKVDTLNSDDTTPIYYVVVHNKLVKVSGLVLLAGVVIDGYYLDRDNAANELVEEEAKTVPPPRLLQLLLLALQRRQPRKSEHTPGIDRITLPAPFYVVFDNTICV